MKNRKLNILLALFVLVLPLGLTGCDDTKAVNQFTLTTNRVARYTEDFIKIVDEAKNQKFLNAQQAAALVTVARQENTANADMVKEAAKYITNNPDGTRELHFTENGRADVVRLGTSARDLALSITNDPILVSLPPDIRSKINLITSGLTAATLSAYTFATKIKVEKK
jgi:hypothetical protein